ncbi:hypothetical protein DMENIID0001_038460 [Sergentomyia squamirostris]
MPCIKLWWSLLWVVIVAFMVDRVDSRVIYYNTSLPLTTTQEVATDTSTTFPEIGFRRIFDAPTVCDPNQRRDARGRCRKVI